MNISKLRQNQKQKQYETLRHPIPQSGWWYTHYGIKAYFLDMAKDAIDTFKPYKTQKHRHRDALQFFTGLKNSLQGALLFLISVVFTTISSLMILVFSCKYLLTGEEAPYDISLYFFRNSFNDLAVSSVQMLRGITQIITAPLTLLRIPLRTFLSKDISWEKFQDRKSVKAMVKKIEDNIDNPAITVGEMYPLLDKLYRKRAIQFLVKHQDEYEGKKIYHQRESGHALNGKYYLWSPNLFISPGGGHKSTIMSYSESLKPLTPDQKSRIIADLEVLKPLSQCPVYSEDNQTNRLSP